MDPEDQNPVSLKKRKADFYNAVKLNRQLFPKQTDGNTNQLYQRWEECERFLQPVISLKNKYKADPDLLDASAMGMFCELLIDCQRYIYELFAIDKLENLYEVTIELADKLADHDKADIKAWAMSMRANTYESIGKVKEAINLNEEGYKIRQAQLPLKGGLLAGFEQNLGYNYNTANRHADALAWFQKSRDTWIGWNTSQGKGPVWPSVTKKNMARCLVYLDRHEEAEELLHTAMAEFKKEEVLNFAMLAYAYFVQGTLQRKTKRLEEAKASFLKAKELWESGDQLKTHPFLAACYYKAGAICLDQGNVEEALKLLSEAQERTYYHRVTMPVEHARSVFKLAEASCKRTSPNFGEIESDRNTAERYLRVRDPGAKYFDTEDCYDLFVPIFWR